MSMKAKKQDAEFQAALRKYGTFNRETGTVKFKDMYVSCYANVCWKGGIISIPLAHLSWFYEHGKWPADGMVIDHVNDDPMDNRPENLREITQAENQEKRRGRMVYRSYGTGKYGYGIGIHSDKRDGRHYITRTLSRGHHSNALKTVKRALGGYATLAEAEARVEQVIAEIEANGDAYVPDAKAPNKKAETNALDAAIPRLRELRKQGHTFQEIANMTGFTVIAVYHRTKDVTVDRRKG
jgi:hypothetical protein